MQFALIRDSYHYNGTPIFASTGFHCYRFGQNIRHNHRHYMILDPTKTRFTWVPLSLETFANEPPACLDLAVSLVYNDVNNIDNIPWIESNDCMYGVNHLDVFGNIFDGISVKSQEEYDKLLALTAAIPDDIVRKCAQLYDENPFPYLNPIATESDVDNLINMTQDFSNINFTDVRISDRDTMVYLSSAVLNYTIGVLFDDNVGISKSVADNPTERWKTCRFIIDKDMVYMVGSRRVNAVSDITENTKYVCGRRVSYKISPFLPHVHYVIASYLNL